MFFAVEDELSEALFRKVLQQRRLGPPFLRELGNKGGEGPIIRNLPKYAQLSEQYPVVIVLDLDRRPCPVQYVSDLLKSARIEVKPKNLQLRIAVTEAESWVLSDIEAWSEFLGTHLDQIRIRRDWEKIDAKEALLLAVSERGSQDQKAALLPLKGTRSKVGLEYNLYLTDFVRQKWSADRASMRSESLRRLIQRLEELV